MKFNRFYSNSKYYSTLKENPSINEDVNFISTSSGLIIEHKGVNTHKKVEPGQLTIVDKVLYRGSGLIKPIYNCRYGFPYGSNVSLTFIYNKPGKESSRGYYMDLQVNDKGSSEIKKILNVTKLEDGTYNVQNVGGPNEIDVLIVYQTLYIEASHTVTRVSITVPLALNASTILPSDTIIARCHYTPSIEVNYCKLIESEEFGAYYNFDNKVLIAKNGSCIITGDVHWIHNPLEFIFDTLQTKGVKDWLSSLVKINSGYRPLLINKIWKKTGIKYKLWIKCRQPYRSNLTRNWYTKFRWFCVEKYKDSQLITELNYQLDNLGKWREPEKGHRIYIPGKVKYQRDSLETPAKKYIRPMYIDFMLAKDDSGYPVEDKNTIKFRIRKQKIGRTPGVENGKLVVERI